MRASKTPMRVKRHPLTTGAAFALNQVVCLLKLHKKILLHRVQVVKLQAVQVLLVVRLAGRYRLLEVRREAVERLSQLGQLLLKV